MSVSMNTFYKGYMIRMELLRHLLSVIHQAELQCCAGPKHRTNPSFPTVATRASRLQIGPQFFHLVQAVPTIFHVQLRSPA